MYDSIYDIRITDYEFFLYKNKVSYVSLIYHFYRDILYIIENSIKKIQHKHFNNGCFI